MKDKLNQKGFLGKIVLLVIFALIFSGIFIYSKLPETLPGDSLYSIKIIVENLKLGFNETSYFNRSLIYLESSNTRIEEAKALVGKRKYEEINKTLEELVIIQSKAIKNIKSTQGHGEGIVRLLAEASVAFQKQHDDVEKIIFEVPSQYYERIQDVISKIELNQNEVSFLQGK